MLTCSTAINDQSHLWPLDLVQLLVPLGICCHPASIVPSHVTVCLIFSIATPGGSYVICRASSIQAKRAFLTTYYDPFYLDLYLYVVKPNITQCAIPSSPWTPSTSAADTSRILAYISNLWEFTLCMVTSWQTQAWDIWTANFPQQGTLAWPPT